MILLLEGTHRLKASQCLHSHGVLGVYYTFRDADVDGMLMLKIVTK